MVMDSFKKYNGLPQVVFRGCEWKNIVRCRYHFSTNLAHGCDAIIPMPSHEASAPQWDYRQGWCRFRFPFKINRVIKNKLFGSGSLSALEKDIRQCRDKVALASKTWTPCDNLSPCKSVYLIFTQWPSTWLIFSFQLLFSDSCWISQASRVKALAMVENFKLVAPGV